jgi:hypothetical protein
MLWTKSNGDFFVAWGEDRGFEVGLACQPAKLMLVKISDAEAVRLRCVLPTWSLLWVVYVGEI